MPRVSPESCWNIWLGELRRPLEKLIKKFLVAAVEDGLLRGVVHVEDLEEDAEDDGDYDKVEHAGRLDSHSVSTSSQVRMPSIRSQSGPKSAPKAPQPGAALAPPAEFSA